MKSRIRSIAFAPLLICAILAPSGSSAAIDGVVGSDYFEDRFLISVMRGANLAPADFSIGLLTASPELNRLAAREKVISITEFYPGEIHNEILRDVVKRLFVAKIDVNGNLESAINEFDKSAIIEYAEPYYIHHLRYVPDDPLISSWYHLTNIRAYLAWDFIRGDSTSRPILGIVDSGVYYDHPDLEPNIWINSLEDIDGDGAFTDADLDGIDDDGNDFIDDVVGWDFGNSDNIPFEPIPWHGTHVSGCASMACDNDQGGAATGWAARIMCVKAARDNNPNSIPFGYTGITYAANTGATVINLSWGRLGSPSQGEQNIINAVYAMGVVVVAAAGNDNTSAQGYPAAYNHVVAVASVNSSDIKSSFSNYGSWVDISAPGEGVYSTWDHDSYTALDGTSMASPLTSGAVCLIRAANPTMTVDEVVARLLSTADTIDHLNPSYRGLLGSGRVNAAAAVGREIFPLFEIVNLALTITEDDGDQRLNPGERFNLVLTIGNEWQDAQNVVGTIQTDGQFTVLDSVADFGDIPGNGGSGDNSTNPFDVRVDSDAMTGSHEFTLQLRTGTGFQTSATFSVSVTLEQAGFPGNVPGNIESPVLVYDAEGDGSKEIIVGAADRNYYMFEASGSITPNWPKPVSHDGIGGAAAGDLEGDGDIEIIGMARDGNIYAWNADGSSLIGFPRPLGSTMFGTPVVGDIDGDTTLEIIAGTFTTMSIYVLNENGSNYGDWPFVGSSNFYGSAALADIDNDGVNEIIFGDFGATVHALNSDKTYVSGFPVTVTDQMRTAPAVADIDGDGNLNIVIGTRTGDLYVLDNDGTVMPGWPQRAGGALYSAPSLSDIDLDGRLEIIVGCNDGHLYVFNNNGQPQSGFPRATGGIIAASPAIGDIDGDGYPDIAFGTSDGMIYAIDYRGNDLANFPIRATANGQITGSAALTDLDGDGDCEIITGVKAVGNNLEVIDYKADLPQEIFPWPSYGKNIGRTAYYGFFQTSIEERSPLPGVLTLEQNYPNPFNMSTTIGFTLPAGSNVTFEIYDLLGRRIRTLHSGYLNSGLHAVVWDGTGEAEVDVPSGIYFYRLEAGRISMTKRMTLVK